MELKVRMLNIDYGKNQGLMEKCRILREYAEFVEIAKNYIAEEEIRQEALNMAVDYCIDHDILSAFLKKYRAEVLGMLLEEFDVDKYERTIKAEGREEGLEIGKEQGLAQGLERMVLLTGKLLEQNRIEKEKSS